MLSSFTIGECFTLLDGDALGGEHPALLMDHLVGGERAGRQAGENDESEQNGLVHGISLGSLGLGSAREDRTAVGLRLLVRVFMKATRSDFSWAVRPSGFIRSERLGRSTPPRS
jgi:hypothetical protein